MVFKRNLSLPKQKESFLIQAYLYVVEHGGDSFYFHIFLLLCTISLLKNLFFIAFLYVYGVCMDVHVQVHMYICVYVCTWVYKFALM